MLIQFACDPVPVEVVDNFLKNLEEVVKGVKKGVITSDFIMRLM